MRTADSRHNCPVFLNLYRNSIPHSPDRVWVADITYVALASGVAFLAAILDACSRMVVGYAIGRHIYTELTLAARSPLSPVFTSLCRLKSIGLGKHDVVFIRHLHGQRQTVWAKR
ncbi:DDE-type integrase/transposase/recombinase [Paraburkholderia caledonica]|uniref:DDE-type integrase/transposase/recombinase n=1 Tax=Paraburkholderia caledonica TaxID=134536 RepID=UPI003CC60CA4